LWSAVEAGSAPSWAPKVDGGGGMSTETAAVAASGFCCFSRPLRPPTLTPSRMCLSRAPAAVPLLCGAELAREDAVVPRGSPILALRRPLPGPGGASLPPPALPRAACRSPSLHGYPQQNRGCKKKSTEDGAEGRTVALVRKQPLTPCARNRRAWRAFVCGRIPLCLVWRRPRSHVERVGALGPPTVPEPGKSGPRVDEKTSKAVCRHGSPRVGSVAWTPTA